MDLSFENSDLEDLSLRVACKTDLPPPVVATFRKKLQMLLAGSSRASFNNLKSMQLLPITGNGANTYFVDLVHGWRLILSFQDKDHVKIIDIHKN